MQYVQAASGEWELGAMDVSGGAVSSSGKCSVAETSWLYCHVLVKRQPLGNVSRPEPWNLPER